MIRQAEARWARDDVPRQWVAHVQPFGNPADPVLCRRYPVPGHEVDGDYPPTVELSADEWRALTETAGDDTEISRRLDALVWPKGVPDGAE